MLSEEASENSIVGVGVEKAKNTVEGPLMTDNTDVFQVKTDPGADGHVVYCSFVA